MRFTNYLIIVALFLCGLNSFAQVTDNILHPIQVSSSDNSALTSGVAALYANPAGLGVSPNSWSFILAGQNRFVTEIKSISAGVLRKFDKSAIGFQVGSYGIDEFDETHTSLGFSRQLGLNSHLGIQCHFYQLQIENLGSTSDFDLSIGFWSQNKNKWIFSAYILNPLQALSNDDNEKFGKIDFSLSHEISETLQMFLGTSFNWNQDYSIRPGIHYKPSSGLALLISYNSNPSALSFGLNLDIKSEMKLFTGYNTHPFLGSSLAIGLGYSL